METIHKIPSDVDWGDCESDMDIKYSHKSFFGESIDEALPRFENIFWRHVMNCSVYRKYHSVITCLRSELM